MNAINFLKMANMQQMQSKMNFSREKSEEGGSTFLSLLGQAMTEKQVETSSTMSSKDNSELVNLHKLLTEIIPELSFSDTLIDEEMLSIPFVEEFMTELPLELQQQIEQVFANFNSLQELVDNGEAYLQNPAQLLVIVITLAQAEAYSDASSQLAPKLQRQLDQILPMLLSQENKDNKINAIVDTITSSNSKASDLFQGKEFATSFKQLLQHVSANLQLMSSMDKENLGKTFYDHGQSTKGEQIVSEAFSRAKADVLPSTTSGNGILVTGIQLNSLHQFVIHVGEGRGEGQSAEQFLRQFQNILGRSSLMQFPNGVNQLSIKLFPENLGRLDVRLTEQNGVIVAQLMTTTKAAKSALESQLHHLRQAFIAQNIQVEKIEINIQQPQQQPLNQSDKQNQHQQNQNDQAETEQQTENDNVEEEIRFEDFLEDTFNTKV